MRSPRRHKPRAPVAAGLLAAVLSLLLGACAPSGPRPDGTVSPRDARNGAPDNGAPAGGPADPGTVPAPLRFQIIYVVHGDAGYTYYEQDGVRRLADTEAVAQAEEVARNSPAAEVFIFHQKPMPFLRFFRGPDGTLRHYRGGKLLRTETYTRTTREGGLGTEADLYRKYASAPPPTACPAAPGTGPARILLYFGHEIPVTGRVPYSRSRPDLAFTVASFARGLERFGGPACPGAKPFSLVVLSACHGGTPAATRAIAPFAAYILASPGELHLSFLDTRALARLARENPSPFGTFHAEMWGRTLAMESFARLREKTSTAITLSLYDTDKASAYLEARRSAWEAPVGKGPALASPPGPETYRDCSESPSFGAGGEEAGATVYYRAPKFGADKGRLAHSGWECPAPAPARLGSLP